MHQTNVERKDSIYILYGIFIADRRPVSVAVRSVVPDL